MQHARFAVNNMMILRSRVTDASHNVIHAFLNIFSYKYKTDLNILNLITAALDLWLVVVGVPDLSSCITFFLSRSVCGSFSH